MRGRITAIEVQKSHPLRYSIFVEGRYVCGIDAEVVQELNLKEGQEIEEEEILKVVYAEEFRRARDYALTLLTYRPRSRKELMTRLKDANYDQAIIEMVVESLERVGLIDDRSFAESWAREGLNSKMLGAKRVYRELQTKGVSSEIIKEAIGKIYGEIDEFKLAYSLTKKRLHLYGDLSNPKERRRLQDFLLRRGYSYEIVGKVIEMVEREERVK